jgi:capsular exopolysaccharide synthesis family protein
MFLSALRRRWGVFLLVFVAGVIVLFLLNRVTTAPETWSAEARVRMPNPPDGLSGEVLPLAAALYLELPAVQGSTEEAFIEVLKRANEKLKDEALRGRLIGKIAAATSLRPAPGGVVVRANSPSHAEAVDLANATAHALKWDARSKRAEEFVRLQNRIQALRERLEGQELGFEPEEERLQDRERRKEGLSTAAVQLEKRIEDTRARQDRTLARIRSLEAAEHRLRESVPSGPEEWGLKSAVLDRLRQEINAIRSEIALRRLSRTPDHDDYKRLTARLAELDEEHRAELYRVRASTIVSLKEEVNRIEDEMRLLDERRMRHSLELHGLGDEIRDSQTRRDALVRTRKSLAEEEEKQRRLGPDWTPPSVEEAVSATSSAPRNGSGLWLGGALVILLLSAGAAMAAERGDTRVRTDADVKRHLNLATLAVVEAGPQPLVLRAHPLEPVCESYSAAAAVLRGYLKERDFKVCAVSSAGAREGKSTVTANLAVALARKGLNVALVDGDLRAPRLHEIFGTENTQGLSTVLMGGEIDPELAAGATELAGLRLLPSGPVAELPPELLESGRMGDLLRALRERYDVVLLDGPPLGMTGDAVTLARHADTVVWVIRSGASTRGELGWVKHLLRNLRADVAGAVLTEAPRSGERRSYVYPMEAART